MGLYQRDRHGQGEDFTLLQIIIDLGESDMENINVEKEIEGEEEGGMGLKSPFIVKKR